jgi:transcriptional regulator GlxA family with amidase domain
MADSNFDVEWFAEEVGMSRRHLHRRLRETAGLSPAGYIRMMRLERAAQLLEQQAGSVSEIAYDVGFKNPDHFSRLFQQVFGVSPSKYPSEKD